jgi:hypothetical protein
MMRVGIKKDMMAINCNTARNWRQIKCSKFEDGQIDRKLVEVADRRNQIIEVKRQKVIDFMNHGENRKCLRDDITKKLLKYLDSNAFLRGWLAIIVSLKAF